MVAHRGAVRWEGRHDGTRRGSPVMDHRICRVGRYEDLCLDHGPEDHLPAARHGLRAGDHRTCVDPHEDLCPDHASADHRGGNRPGHYAGNHRGSPVVDHHICAGRREVLCPVHGLEDHLAVAVRFVPAGHRSGAEDVPMRTLDRR